MHDEDVSVSVTAGVLTVSVEKNKQNDSCSFVSSYKESWTLPDGTDEAGVSATMAAGVLTVSLPPAVVHKQQTRKIAIAVTK